MKKSREIIEIISDVVKATAAGCNIKVTHLDGTIEAIVCPEINYIFGNAQYVKDRLDKMSKSVATNDLKFPLIALFCPFNEQRDVPDYFSKATVKILIAYSTHKEWSNEERLVLSFQNILRPIYERLKAELLADGRIDFGYKGLIPHEYSENYSYGRYGAHTGTGDALSEPIDAINISNLELKIKNPSCR